MLRKTALFAFLFVSLAALKGFSQPTWTLDPFGKEKKPAQYEEKKLASEKTGDKKFTTFRRFVQNNVTHYNFHFNAKNKLNGVLERARLAHVDDYSRLLTFYPYTLENTASQQVELDSVIYKSTAGILLHDLRNDWVDNLYLLIGKAYYLRNELDSAALTFQFINYNLFPRKKNEDDNRVVGTNDAAQSSILSIADKEDRNIIQKTFTQPASRNDALIWLTRTLTDKKEYGDAAGLINILHNDPNLPKRLRNDLSEVTAYWFYSQDSYDSASVHLEKALSNAETKQDRARWEFLLGQMNEMVGNFDKASYYYNKAAKHTVDPLMDIHARLNDAKMFRQTGNEKELQNSISRLLKMARKDKYEAYRDIIYYSTGQLSQQIPDTANSFGYYTKSISYNQNNPAYKTRAFLQLANMSYDLRNYRAAFGYYDSIKLDAGTVQGQDFDILERRNSLERIVSFIETIELQDSLQRIAKMEPAARDAFLNDLVKKFRKESGVKEEDNFTGNTLITFNNNNKNAPLDMFSGNQKGEWYFYNNSMKSRGFNEFQGRWGKRPNIDNWRTKTASESLVKGNTGIDGSSNPDSSFTNEPTEMSYDFLLKDVPLTQVQLDTSNSTIKRNLLELANQFQYVLEDHQEAIATYDNYMERFNGEHANGEVYLGLYYSYNKLGNTERANYYKNLLATKHAETVAAQKLLNPPPTDPEKANPEATKIYEEIYNRFVAGDFAQAISLKKQADSSFGSNYWTPQLLYIEALHYVKERNDVAAVTSLNSILTLYPESPLKTKAATMIDVLNRRADIENYLTNLEITRATEDVVVIGSDKPVATVAPREVPVVRRVEPSTNPVITRPDSVVIAPLPGLTSGGFNLTPDHPHYVVMLMDGVDGVYVNEARNAFIRYNREKFYNQPITINKDMFDAGKPMLIFTTFEDADAALAYYDKIKRAAPSEISWLQANKYAFYIITEANLQTLKTNKDINAYKELLNRNYDNRF